MHYPLVGKWLACIQGMRLVKSASTASLSVLVLEIQSLRRYMCACLLTCFFPKRLLRCAYWTR